MMLPNEIRLTTIFTDRRGQMIIDTQQMIYQLLDKIYMIQEGDKDVVRE